MRLYSLPAIFLLSASTLTTHANSLLVGTDLSHPVGGPVLCPGAPNNNVRISAVTCFSTVAIDDVKVAISEFGPSLNSDGHLTVNLTDGLHVFAEPLNTSGGTVGDGDKLRKRNSQSNLRTSSPTFLDGIST